MMEYNHLKAFTDMLQVQDFSLFEDKYANVDWKIYRGFDAYEKFYFNTWLLQKEMKGELRVLDVLNRLTSKEVLYIVSLIKDDKIVYFEKYTEAGDFLGVHQNKVIRNKNKLVNSWLVRPCNIGHIINKHTGEVLETLHWK
ncbi:hypothetical protein M3592_25865 [Priestia aryabhattai]|uniref:hypothetical protein n=1 Tax=Priestia aryabhattai TaxID=412384 RepID=UPI00203F98F0|nr:hypothetical protein [Priestia aryabhattai]MCM2978871.1 hypothetical protein [Priestia aryabhattai]